MNILFSDTTSSFGPHSAADSLPPPQTSSSPARLWSSTARRKLAASPQRSRPSRTQADSGPRLATTHHSLLSLFSAISKRNFATKYAFCRNFQYLQNYLAEFSIFFKIFKFCKILQMFLRNKSDYFFFKNPKKIANCFENPAKFRKICENQLDTLVDFENCWKMRIWLQNFVSI